MAESNKEYWEIKKQKKSACHINDTHPMLLIHETLSLVQSLQVGCQLSES